MGLIKRGKLPCPFEGCGSSDAYHEYEDGSTYCFACSQGTWVRRTINDLESGYTEYRGVPVNIQKKLGFFSFFNEDGEILYREYVYENGNSKFREVIPKKFWSTGKLPKLGGKWMWNAGSSKTICIVEGEEDAASFMVMCDLPVVWLTSASIGSDRKEIYEYLNPFTKIIMCFESDDAANKAKDIIGTMFPGKVFEASLTKFKDANDYLVNKCEKDFFWAVVNAKLYTADFVFNTIADFWSIISDDESNVYTPTPFEGLNKLIKGLPLGRIVLITGLEGLGKTEILRALEYNVLKNHPEYPISITHHEESKLDTLRGLASYYLDKNCNDPDNPVDKKEILEAIANLSKENNLHITEVGSETDNVKAIMDKFSYVVKVCGVKYIFVDPINQFIPPDDGTSDITKFLDSLAQSMGKFVTENNVCCVWTAHVNDDGKTRNSRMISKACGIRIDIERDLMSENDTIRNTTKLFVPKNRPFSKTGIAGSLFFNDETFTIEENTIKLPF